MNHALTDRVSELEKQMAAQIEATANLTLAVNNLTTVLTGGQFAIKILCCLAAGVASIASFVAWISDHIRII